MLRLARSSIFRSCSSSVRNARGYASVVETRSTTATVDAVPPASHASTDVAVPAGSPSGQLVTGIPSAVPSTNADQGGPLRPHLGVEVDPNHGLYAFFRKTGDAVGAENIVYESVEPANPAKAGSGRSWSAAELRLKSFKDLHTLWYVVLRERNVLATQMEEARRIGVQNMNALAVYPRLHQCRKTMARIKYVLNERRLAYENAVKLHEKEIQDAAASAAKEAARAEHRTTGRRTRRSRYLAGQATLGVAPETPAGDIEANPASIKQLTKEGDVADTSADVASSISSTKEAISEVQAEQTTSADSAPLRGSQASKLAADSLFSGRK